MPHPCDLVIPCRDEAPALPLVLSALPEGVRPIVVDNGSTDGTAAVAARLGAVVVSESRAGYGAAVNAGIEAATASIVAVVDGDGSLDPRELPPLIADVACGRADLSVGRRRPVGRGVWPWHARLGTAAVCRWLRATTELGVHDIAPMRVCGREALLELGVADRAFGYPLDLLIRADRAGWTVTEHDVSYVRRAEGTHSKVSGSLVGTIRAVRDFAKALS
jgi:glycosyltransferase involved in cell wall biosynthesis